MFVLIRAKTDTGNQAFFLFRGFINGCFLFFRSRENGTNPLFEVRKIHPDCFKHCLVIHTKIMVHNLVPHSRCRLHGLADVDEETVRLFVRLAKSTGRLPAADEREPVAAILTRLGLMTGDHLNNGAFLLFGKKQDKYLSDAVLRIGRFKDGAVIIGDRWIEGNLFHQLSEGEEALRSFINVRYEISGKTPERREHWDYPLPALREALMNALVHRDYFKKNEQIMIKVYDDVIWFHNPGGLPKGLSIEQLKTKPQSIPRNPLIAKIFYLAGYIERYGSGIQRILTSFAEAGLPEPEFRTDAWSFTLTMHKDIFTEEYLAQRELSERQLQAIPILRKQKSISKREYQDLVSVSPRTALNDLTLLVNKGVLVRTGSGKSSRYTLSTKPKKELRGNT